MAGHCIVPGLHSYWDHDIWYYSWIIRRLVTIGYRHICLYIVDFATRTISLKLANKTRQIFTKNNYLSCCLTLNYFLNINIHILDHQDQDQDHCRARRRTGTLDRGIWFVKEVKYHNTLMLMIMEFLLFCILSCNRLGQSLYLFT